LLDREVNVGLEFVLIVLVFAIEWFRPAHRICQNSAEIVGLRIGGELEMYRPNIKVRR